MSPLLKPFTEKELASALEEVLGRRNFEAVRRKDSKIFRDHEPFRVRKTVDKLQTLFLSQSEDCGA